MKKIMTVLFIALAITQVACTSKTTQKDASQEAVQQEVHTQAPVLKVDDLMQDPSTYYGKEISIEGVAKHVCEHTHRKLFVEGVSGKSIIRCIPSNRAPYSNDLLGKIVVVKGHLVEDRIDEAYLKNWEAQLAKKTYEEHGKEGQGGCSTEKKARQERGNTPQQRIEDFRQRISERKEKDNKDYLSFYHFESTSVVAS